MRQANDLFQVHRYRLVIAVLAALLVTQETQAPPSWWVLSALYAGSVAADWHSTNSVLDNPACYERNPILGRHPSRTRVAAWMLAGGAGAYLIANQVRKSGRPRLARGLLIGMTVIEAGLAVRNQRLDP
jgi:hypothetical protein